MSVLVFAGVLSIPSAVFAEASWYGSLRGGLQVGGGGDAQYFDGGSRWGVRGSAEASEGLTAVYQFETKVSTTDASQPGGRLAYAGLSGGFGTVTLGQIWNAAFNHAGAITDKSYYFGDAGTGYRHGNTLSYAFSSGSVDFQMDLISNGGMDTGKAVDKAEFGMTVGLGDIGKVAIAHTTMNNTLTGMATYWVNDATTGAATSTEAHQIMVTYAADDTTNVDKDGKLTTVANIRHDGTKYRVEDSDGANCDASDADADNACMTTTAYVSTKTTRDTGSGTATETIETFHLADGVTETPAGSVDEPGYKSTHIAVEFGLGGMTPIWAIHKERRMVLRLKQKPFITV